VQLKATGLDLCAECGYQLKGVESAKCPECGRTRSDPARAQYPLAIRLLLWAGLLLAVVQLFIVAPLSLLAGRFAWIHAPALLCWTCLGVYCWKCVSPCLGRRRPLRFR
jgi:hypothetical protein